MKLKSVVTCLLASAALVGCAMSETADGAKKTLTEKGYSVSVLGEEELSLFISGLEEEFKPFPKR